jgi:hypothetical protein
MEPPSVRSTVCELTPRKENVLVDCKSKHFSQEEFGTSSVVHKPTSHHDHLISHGVTRFDAAGPNNCLVNVEPQENIPPSTWQSGTYINSARTPDHWPCFAPRKLKSKSRKHIKNCALKSEQATTHTSTKHLNIQCPMAIKYFEKCQPSEATVRIVSRFLYQAEALFGGVSSSPIS